MFMITLWSKHENQSSHLKGATIWISKLQLAHFMKDQATSYPQMEIRSRNFYKDLQHQQLAICIVWVQLTFEGSDLMFLLTRIVPKVTYICVSYHDVLPNPMVPWTQCLYWPNDSTKTWDNPSYAESTRIQLSRSILWRPQFPQNWNHTEGTKWYNNAP